MKTGIIPADGSRPIGPYSPGIAAQGVVFCSGQVGIDPKTGSMPADTAAQTSLALDNLNRVLKSEGLSLDDMVKTTVFMTDISEFKLMNQEYAKHFNPPYPARSTVQVTALPGGAKVEIEGIALGRK